MTNQNRRSRPPLGLRMLNFGRNLMRNYFPSEEMPAASPPPPMPSWKSATEQPLMWEEPANTPSQEQYEPAPQYFEPPAQPQPRPAAPPNPTVQRKPKANSTADDSRLLAILRKHEEAESERDRIREEKKAAFSASDVQRSADPAAPPSTRRRRGKTSFEYIETSSLTGGEHHETVNSAPAPAEQPAVDLQREVPEDEPFWSADESSEDDHSSSDEPPINRADPADIIRRSESLPPSQPAHTPERQSFSDYDYIDASYEETEVIQRTPDLSASSPAVDFVDDVSYDGYEDTAPIQRSVDRPSTPRPQPTQSPRVPGQPSRQAPVEPDFSADMSDYADVSNEVSYDDDAPIQRSADRPSTPRTQPTQNPRVPDQSSQVQSFEPDFSDYADVSDEVSYDDAPIQRSVDRPSTPRPQPTQSPRVPGQPSRQAPVEPDFSADMSDYADVSDEVSYDDAPIQRSADRPSTPRTQPTQNPRVPDQPSRQAPVEPDFSADMSDYTDVSDEVSYDDAPIQRSPERSTTPRTQPTQSPRVPGQPSRQTPVEPDFSADMSDYADVSDEVSYDNAPIQRSADRPSTPRTQPTQNPRVPDQPSRQAPVEPDFSADMADYDDVSYDDAPIQRSADRPSMPRTQPTQNPRVPDQPSRQAPVEPDFNADMSDYADVSDEVSYDDAPIQRSVDRPSTPRSQPTQSPRIPDQPSRQAPVEPDFNVDMTDYDDVSYDDAPIQRSADRPSTPRTQPTQSPRTFDQPSVEADFTDVSYDAPIQRSPERPTQRPSVQSDFSDKVVSDQPIQRTPDRPSRSASIESRDADFSHEPQWVDQSEPEGDAPDLYRALVDAGMVSSGPRQTDHSPEPPSIEGSTRARGIRRKVRSEVETVTSSSTESRSSRQSESNSSTPIPNPETITRNEPPVQRKPVEAQQETPRPQVDTTPAEPQVQRAVTIDEVNVETTPAEGADVDVDKLARDVFSRLRNRLRIENERKKRK